MAWRRRRTTDGGTTHVLEAVILALILLSAAYSVVALRDQGGEVNRPRQKLEALTQDALIVLDGLEEPRGRLLDVYLAEAFHCAVGTPGSENDCEGARGDNLSFKLEHYLPHGAGYAYGISNGASQRMLYRSLLPEGETVTASRAISPDWSLTLLATELSCYDPGVDVGVLAMPIWHAGTARPAQLNVTVGGVNATAAEGADGVWRAVLPTLTRPDSGTLSADVNATDGTYAGATAYGACDLAGLGLALTEELSASTFEVTGGSAPLAGAASLRWDLSRLDALPGVDVASATVDLYAPLPPLGDAADRYARVGGLSLGAAAAGVAAWAVPPDSLYGAHRAVLRATLDLPNGEQVEVRKLAIVNVGLSTGEVPIDPIYRVVLQAWFPDWR